MQGKILFEYAVIRLVPRVEREEFINVGVVLYCSKKQFLQVKFTLLPHRVKALDAIIDVDEIEARLQSLQNICMANKNAGPIAQLPIASRFRWLTANKSTVLQTSAVHPGFCGDPGHELDKLFTKLVEVNRGQITQ